MSFLSELFGTEKPIIGLVHIQALPGDPFYKGEGMDAVIQRAKADPGGASEWRRGRRPFYQ